jgi:hypothetical protein
LSISPNEFAESGLQSVPLYLKPLIPLRWRAAGTDGSSELPVPQFFLDRGVQPAPEINLELLEAGVFQTTPRQPGSRLLRSCDLILHQPREALTSDIQLQPGLATGFSNVQQTLGLASPPPEDQLRILVGTFTPTPGIDPTRLDFTEATWDEVLVCTVYLLSPPNAEAGSQPDGTWLPFVRHALFWNLQHDQPRLRWFDSDPTIPFIPPLAGGAAQLVVNILTASLNDGLQDALNRITGESRAGTFWTPTGGGSTAVFPEIPATPATGSTGLDKGGRLQAEKLAAQTKKLRERLDPAFPYRAERFDPELLLQ